MIEMLLKRVEELARENFVHELNLWNLLMYLKGGRDSLELVQLKDEHGKVIAELKERMEKVRAFQERASGIQEPDGLMEEFNDELMKSERL